MDAIEVESAAHSRRLALGVDLVAAQILVTHRELAAQVGASRANVSRALRILERQGHVIRHRGRVELL